MGFIQSLIGNLSTKYFSEPTLVSSYPSNPKIFCQIVIASLPQSQKLSSSESAMTRGTETK